MSRCCRKTSQFPLRKRLRGGVNVEMTLGIESDNATPSVICPVKMPSGETESKDSSFLRTASTKGCSK